MVHHKTLVQEWMSVNPLTVATDTSLMHAYSLMRTRSIRRLPVVDEQGHLVGILTASDIEKVLPFVDHDANQVDALFTLAGRTVDEIMTRNPVFVAPDDPIQRAARRLIARKVSGLPVVSAGKVVGVITESDIFRMVVAEWGEEEAVG